jgi:hypothetical protein
MPVHKISHNGGFARISGNIRKLAKSSVLVGIPSKDNARKGDPLGNAALLYLHTHGSELQNIPKRPVIEPALKENRDLYMPELREAVATAIDGEEFTTHLDKAGTIAANSAKRWFVDPRNNWPPNAPATIKDKGSDQPLIDTGELRRSITHVVRTDKS